MLKNEKHQYEIKELQKKVNILNLTHAKNKILIIETLVKKYGTEVYQVLEHGIGSDTISMFGELGARTKNRSIEELIEILWEPLKKDGFEYSIENRSDGVQMKCTKCPYADLYKSLDSVKIGYILYCAQDQYLNEGFNKNIGFKRTKTIMEGDDYCDHFYFMK